MPIAGISEVRRLPRIGKIRLGVKETSQRTGHEFPKAVDYFVVKADDSTPESAAEAFRQVYGEHPRALDIMFPIEDETKFFSQFYRRYGSGAGLLCKGDGVTATEVDRETGELREVECNPAECEWAEKKHCRPIGTLQFILPKVAGLGIWQIDTTSYHSIVNINSAIDFIRAITGGKVAMIPLKLVLRPREVQVEGKKKVVHVMDIAHDGLRLQDVLRASQTPLAGLLMPPADLDEVPDDVYPESVVRESRKATRAARQAAATPNPAEPATVEAEPAAAQPEEWRADPRKAELEAEIEKGFLMLGFPPAKRAAWRQKYEDPETLVAALREEADREAGAKAGSAAPARGGRPATSRSESQRTAAGAQEASAQRSFF